MFSQTTEYALRAAVRLAEAGERSLTTAEIAGDTNVPAGYLSKVLQQLTRAGLVRAVRGLGGGYRLSRPPGSLTVLDVVNAVEPLRRIHRCPLGLTQHTTLCPLHQQLDDAASQLETHLGGKTLADLLAGPPTSAPGPRATCRSTCLGLGAGSPLPSPSQEDAHDPPGHPSPPAA